MGIFERLFKRGEQKEEKEILATILAIKEPGMMLDYDQYRTLLSISLALKSHVGGTLSAKQAKEFETMGIIQAAYFYYNDEGEKICVGEVVDSMGEKIRMKKEAEERIKNQEFWDYRARYGRWNSSTDTRFWTDFNNF